MATLIIYTSVHHGNTAKLANTLADILQADLVKTEDATEQQLSRYDLVGFGSGIYFGKHHEDLLKFVDALHGQQDRKAFIFSTSGRGGASGHRTLRKKLLEKDFQIIGQFSCKGYDTYSLFKLIGGINRGRPNEQDLQDAARFAKSLIHQAEVL